MGRPDPLDSPLSYALGPMSARPAALAFIFVLVVVDVIAMGVVIPVLPKLVESFEGGDTARAAEVYGVFGTAWALMQFLCMPILGAMSDRFGRRPVILVSCFGLGFDYFLMALAPNLAWLFVGPRDLGHHGGELLDRVRLHRRRVAAGEARRRLRAWSARASAWASRWARRWAACWAASTRGCRSGWRAGSRSPTRPTATSCCRSRSPKEKRAAFSWKRANPVGSLKLLRSHRELFGIAAVLFLMQLSHVVFPAVTVLYMGYRYGVGRRRPWAWCSPAVGVCSMIVQGGLIRPVVKRIGERHALGAGLAFGAVGMAIYGVASSGAVFLVGHPGDGALGARGPVGAGDHEPAREPVGAGPAAGRQLQPAGDHGDDRADALHAGVRAVDREGCGRAPAGPAVLRGLGDAGASRESSRGA